MCVCNDGYEGDGKKDSVDPNNTGCQNIDECSDNALNDCIAVSDANANGFPVTDPLTTSVCTDVDEPTLGGQLYTCSCPAGTKGGSTQRAPVSLATALTSAAGGDGKTPASGGSGCPATVLEAAIFRASDFNNVVADTKDACEAACASPDAMCYRDYLDAGNDDYSCACMLGFKGVGTDQEGCTRLAPVVGEQQTLGTASQNIDDATNTLRTYLTEKADYELAQCTEFDTQAACDAATAEYEEADALKTLAENERDQAVAYAATMEAAYDAAVLKNEVGADRGEVDDSTTPYAVEGRLQQEAYDAWQAAQAVADAYTTANSGYVDGNTTDTTDAKETMDNVCYVANPNTGDCVCTTDGVTADCPADFMCLGKAQYEDSVAEGDYNNAKTAAEGDNLIPEILTPDTANPYQDPFDEFNYADKDGDLIPDQFDACPNQMGLRRDRVAMGIKTSTSVGGVEYSAGENLGIDNPGPQDFCPSGCPETGEDGTTVLDTDEDGIPDCEDRCPFVKGIRYNHAWTFAVKDDLGSLDRNLDYNGCPDFGKICFLVEFFSPFVGISSRLSF